MKGFVKSRGMKRKLKFNFFTIFLIFTSLRPHLGKLTPSFPCKRRLSELRLLIHAFSSPDFRVRKMGSLIGSSGEPI